MPAVDVYYNPEFMNSVIAEDIKHILRRQAPLVLSPAGHPFLKPEQFSFKFHVPGEYDEMSCAIIVRIHLRHTPSWVTIDHTEGTVSESAQYLAIWLRRMLPIADQQVGVEIVLNDSYWASMDKKDSSIVPSP